MRYLSFEIFNFKGIKRLLVDLDGNPPSRVFTLVGLNESGKTTILDALYYFNEGIEAEDIEEVLHEARFPIYSLIPKNRQDNFTDSIKIQAWLKLEDKDTECINRLLKSNNFILNEIDHKVKLRLEYSFSNSSFVDKIIDWEIDGSVRKLKGKKIFPLIKEDSNHNLIKSALLPRLPKIIYYPNFLFEFPDKIYLEEKDNEGDKQEFYRNLLQDILDSLENDLDLNTHIVERAKRAAERPQERAFLESVLSKMGIKITKTVFNSELSVFRGNATNKTITLDYPKTDSKDLLFTRLQLREGEDNYYIRERSLGFKWFFTFLLFTQFRIRRIENSSIIFLLDEPASNLHQTAQQRLLNALESLTSPSVSVVYTTHSHHLINPLWLESTFIVRNKALDYERDDDSYNAFMTDVTIEKYRSFVGNNPNQATYFQPILDVLEYKPSNLENIPNIVMIEGKTDFYTISYLQDSVLDKSKRLNLLPGMGSGGLDDAIRFYYAWGRNFVVLLDSDTEGEKQKQRYIDKFNGLVKNRIFTFGDIDLDWKDKEIEFLFEKEDIASIQKATKLAVIDPQSGKFNKKLLHLGVQELLVNKEKIVFSNKLENKIEKINIFLKTHLQEKNEF